MNKLVRSSNAIGKVLVIGVITILLVTMVAIGFVMSSTIDSLKNEKTNLQSDITSLQFNNTQLQGNYSTLQSLYASLQLNNTQLQSSYTSLQSQYSTLQSSNTQLQSSYTSLQSQYSTLQSSNTQLQSQVTSLQSQIATLQSQYNSLQTSNTQLQSQVTSLQSQIATLQSELSNATALIDQLTGTAGILPTYMDLHYVAPTGSPSYYFLQLSLKNNGTVPITQIFVTINSVQVQMTFTYLNSTISTTTPLPAYQTTNGGLNVTPPINEIGTYPLIIQAVTANSTIYTYQTTITTRLG